MVSFRIYQCPTPSLACTTSALGGIAMPAYCMLLGRARRHRSTRRGLAVLSCPEFSGRPGLGCWTGQPTTLLCPCQLPAEAAQVTEQRGRRNHLLGHSLHRSAHEAKAWDGDKRQREREREKSGVRKKRMHGRSVVRWVVSGQWFRSVVRAARFCQSVGRSAGR